MSFDVKITQDEFYFLQALKLTPEDQAYGVPLREKMEELKKRSVSVGLFYSIAKQLENKTLIIHEIKHDAECNINRGGRPKCFSSSLKVE